MKRYILPLLLLSALLLTGCNDAFMNRQPKTEIGASNFFNSEEDLKMYIYGLYNFPGHGNYAADGGTDNQATTSGSVEIKNIMLAPAPNSSTITGGWSWSRLKEINFFLSHAQEAPIPDEVKNHYIGVARFFRARFYMGMVKRYSDIPWYDDYIEADNEELLFKGRDPRSLVVERLMADYEFAAKHVRADQPDGAVDKWTVLTYYSRDALYEGTFRKYHPELKLESTATAFLQLARDKAKEVMDANVFAIHSTGDIDSDYLELFRSTDLSGNPEMILVTYYDGKEVKAGTSEWNFGNYEPSPAKDLLQAYLMRDGSYYSSQEGYREFEFVKEFENRDPRLSQTYAYPGWELLQTNTYVSGAGLYVQQLNKNFTGYHLIKGFTNNKEREVQDQRDYPVLRYAEVLLNYAEAMAELGTFDKNVADRTVNLLRRRVGMPDFDMSPMPEPLSVSKYGDISPLLQEVRRERRVELAFEGHRYDDLMRWGAGKVLERVPEGLYFPSLGKFDLNGDGIEDIHLISTSEDIPADDDKEVNSLGQKLVYYRTGPISDSRATVYLSEGDKGVIVTATTMGRFEVPKYYYRPIPAKEMSLNDNLGPQLFGWN
ncbi:MAG: RagB/SusD family nutrient uptake outer membrane protein [Porphyromonas sp.]|nr:RagB/SusD family nutrient uptake outer membrane protein [Porphyromonas sp.]